MKHLMGGEMRAGSRWEQAADESRRQMICFVEQEADECRGQMSEDESRGKSPMIEQGADGRPAHEREAERQHLDAACKLQRCFSSSRRVSVSWFLKPSMSPRKRCSEAVILSPMRCSEAVILSLRSTSSVRSSLPRAHMPTTAVAVTPSQRRSTCTKPQQGTGGGRDNGVGSQRASAGSWDARMATRFPASFGAFWG